VPAGAVAGATGQAVAAAPPFVSRVVPLVSPLRGGGVKGTIEVVISGTRPMTVVAAVQVAEPRAEPAEPAAMVAMDPDHDEPPLPDEARDRVAADERAPTDPLQAVAGQSLQVRFRSAPQETLVEAFKALNQLIRGHPGETPVVLNIPSAGGREQAMELPLRVAFDAELVASVRRRFGDGLVTLELSGA
jgi:hypothetical protein